MSNKKIKIIYLANARIPTEKAHGVQIVKMCEAFADQGVVVELIVPTRKTQIKEDPFTYYGVKRNFKLTKLWCLDTIRFGRPGFWVETLSFSLSVIWCSLFRREVFYTRDEFLAFCLNLFDKKVVWEVHMGQQNLFARSLLRSKIPMVAISSGLKDLYVRLGVPKERILVASDGVDLKQFDVGLSQIEARKRLGLAKEAKLVIYTGSNYSWKGVDTLMATKNLFSPEVDLLIVSGKPYTEIPLYLKASDILVLPNTAKEEVSKTYTSPMKLFEYMASGRPIVASDIPSIREILNNRNALFVQPDNPEDFALKIKQLLENKDFANKISIQALRDVRAYTWESRAKLILDFIK